jgi:hypothetical protein
MLNVIMLSVVILNDIMLSVVILNVVMLRVIAPQNNLKILARNFPNAPNFAAIKCL